MGHKKGKRKNLKLSSACSGPIAGCYCCRIDVAKNGRNRELSYAVWRAVRAAIMKTLGNIPCVGLGFPNITM